MVWLILGVGGMALYLALARPILFAGRSRGLLPGGAESTGRARRPDLSVVESGGELPGPPGLCREPAARAGLRHAGTLFQFSVEHAEVLVPHWPGKRRVGHLIVLRSPQLLLQPFVIHSQDWRVESARNVRLGPGHQSGDLDFGRWSDRPTLAGENGMLTVICWYREASIWPAIARAGAIGRQLAAWKVNPSVGRAELRPPPSGEDAGESEWRCPMCGALGPEGSRCFGCHQTLVAGSLFQETRATRLPGPEELRRAGKIADEGSLTEALELMESHRIPTVIIGSPPTLCVFEPDERRARHLLDALEAESG